MYCFLSIVLVFIGIVLFLRGVLILSRGRHIERVWVKTSINIINSVVDSVSCVMRYNTSIEYFYPSVTYEYEVKGYKICSNSVSIEKKGLWTESNTEAQELLNQILTAPTAYFNPNNIRESVIFPNLSKMRKSHNWSLVISGIMLIAMGVTFCLIGTR